MSESKHPTCDAWGKVHDNATVIHEFLDFLNAEGIVLAQYGDGVNLSEHKLYGINERRESLIYRHFGIDANELEKERREILASINQ